MQQLLRRRVMMLVCCWASHTSQVLPSCCMFVIILLFFPVLRGPVPHRHPRVLFCCQQQQQQPRHAHRQQAALNAAVLNVIQATYQFTLSMIYLLLAKGSGVHPVQALFTSLASQAAAATGGAG